MHKDKGDNMEQLLAAACLRTSDIHICDRCDESCLCRVLADHLEIFDMRMWKFFLCPIETDHLNKNFKLSSTCLYCDESSFIEFHWLGMNKIIHLNTVTETLNFD